MTALFFSPGLLRSTIRAAERLSHLRTYLSACDHVPHKNRRHIIKKRNGTIVDFSGFMSTGCSYCDLAQKTGELFCSRHSSNMQDLASGVFMINAKSLEECDWHITRLSLNFNLDDRQRYRVENRDHHVSPGKYLMINEGQSFRTSAQGETDQRMITLAFKAGLPARLYQSMFQRDILELPETNNPVGFIEKTYPMDDFLESNLQWLLNAGTHPMYQNELQEYLENILAHVLTLQHGIHREIATINKVKSSTRVEIYKRLHWAIDYIHENYRQPITVEQLAAEACISAFHFKRLFREYFRQPPYQYIKKLRLQKAQSLLLEGMPVNEVCRNVGWEDPSSFIRLFKKEMNITPNSYRR